MKVLIAASEAVPFAKTGGLADVMGSLVTELRNLGFDAQIMLPLYRGIKSRFKLEYTGLTINVPLGSQHHSARVFSYGRYAFFIEHKGFFDRKEIYGTSSGEYEDNAFRFIFFSKAVLETCGALGLRPDVIHCNDWQTGLVPLYLKTIYKEGFERTASVLTIHNLGYQGLFPASAMPLTGLPTDMFNPRELEFYGKLNLLKAGIISADAVSTVSRNYAREIAREEFGFGLEGVLKNRGGDVTGIVNGLDYQRWNPETDAFIDNKFGPDSLEGKELCKSHLVARCSFRDGLAPVAGMVSRLATQKGVELMLDVADTLCSLGLNVAVLGRGEEEFQKRLRQVSRKYSEGFSFTAGYDEELAHQIYAGADMFFIPSQYEPCGLTQMIAMRYGTVPVARATGGIVDTVDDYDHLRGEGTGFLFSDYTPSSFLECVKRALCVYSDPRKWKAIVAEGMKKKFSWEDSAAKYVSLYRKVARKAKA